MFLFQFKKCVRVRHECNCLLSPRRKSKFTSVVRAFFPRNVLLHSSTTYEHFKCQANNRLTLSGCQPSQSPVLELVSLHRNDLRDHLWRSSSQAQSVADRFSRTKKKHTRKTKNKEADLFLCIIYVSWDAINSYACSAHSLQYITQTDAWSVRSVDIARREWARARRSCVYTD